MESNKEVEEDLFLLSTENGELRAELWLCCSDELGYCFRVDLLSKRPQEQFTEKDYKWLAEALVELDEWMGTTGRGLIRRLNRPGRGPADSTVH